MCDSFQLEKMGKYTVKKYVYFKKQTNKQNHRKVLRNSFHLNVHTLGFHLQTKRIRTRCTEKVPFSSSHFNCHILGFCPQTQNLEPTCSPTENSTTEKLLFPRSF